MIGLLMIGAKIICEAVNGVKDIVENNERKETCSLYDGTVYIDNRGRDRWSENNREVYIGRDMMGDFVIKDLYSGYVYRNISEEENRIDMQEEIENCKKNGNTTVCLGLYRNYKGNILGITQGARFKDIETGAIYVIRKIKDQYYYVNPSSLTVIRRTDRSEFLGEYKPEMGTVFYPETIEDYNKKYAGSEYGKNWHDGMDWVEVMHHKGKFR